MSSERVKRGLNVKEELLGMEIPADEFNVDQRRMVLEYCWDGVWGRETLVRKHRSFLQMGILAGLNRLNEFRSHVRLAIKNGCTADDLREVCLQITVYCGVPIGTEATKIARDVLIEHGHQFAPVDVAEAT